MIVSADSLALAYKGFKAVFTEAHLEAPSNSDKIVMTVPSSSRDETYGWLGQFPAMREWVGQRQVKNLEAHSFTIKNRKFESTIAVSRDDISDDRLGVFKPMFSEMGRNARQHPEELVFNLLKSGFTANCYDSQFFFDVDHPVSDKDGNTTNVSNVQTGAGPNWFLLDTSRAIRPIIWQEREKYEFQQIAKDGDEYVFRSDEYLYGIRARVNAGFGLWQLAFGSKAALDETNYAAARAAMMDYRTDGGRILGVTPTVLVVPPSLESAALYLLNTEIKAGGGSNPWKGTAQLIVSPYVA